MKDQEIKEHFKKIMEADTADLAPFGEMIPKDERSPFKWHRWVAAAALLGVVGLFVFWMSQQKSPSELGEIPEIQPLIITQTLVKQSKSQLNGSDLMSWESPTSNLLMQASQLPNFK